MNKSKVARSLWPTVYYLRSFAWRTCRYDVSQLVFLLFLRQARAPVTKKQQKITVFIN